MDLGSVSPEAAHTLDEAFTTMHGEPGSAATTAGASRPRQRTAARIRARGLRKSPAPPLFVGFCSPARRALGRLARQESGLGKRGRAVLGFPACAPVGVAVVIRSVEPERETSVGFRVPWFRSVPGAQAGTPPSRAGPSRRSRRSRGWCCGPASVAPAAVAAV